MVFIFGFVGIHVNADAVIIVCSISFQCQMWVFMFMRQDFWPDLWNRMLLCFKVTQDWNRKKEKSHLDPGSGPLIIV